MAGFGFSNLRIGTGAYNRERKAAIARHAVADRDALWGAGARSPVGSRVFQRLAFLACGTFGDAHAADDAILLSDFYPVAQSAYDSFSVSRKKVGPRGKHPPASDFPRNALNVISQFGFCDLERGKQEAITDMETLGEPHPELFAIKLAVDSWVEMELRYIAQIKDGEAKRYECYQRLFGVEIFSGTL